MLLLRALMIALVFALGVAAPSADAKRMKVKGSRAAPTNTIVPYSPLWTSATPSAGQVALAWQAVTQLWGGTDISNGPVLYYRVRRGTTAASVEVGGTPTASDTTTSLTYTFTSLSSGAQWFSVSAVNAAGESEAAIPYEVTVP